MNERDIRGRMIRLAAFLLTLLLAAPATRAAETPPHVTSRTTSTLVTDTDAAQPGTPLHLALRLQMKPGWHTYWQNPGDAGLPPELTLTLPPGTTATPIAWPLPHRQPEGPLMTYGYAGDLVLSLTITPGNEPFSLDASANWLVCEKVCVPEEATFHLALPAGAPFPSPQAPLIAAALAQLPTQSANTALWAPNGTLTLTGPALSPATVRDAWFLPDQPGHVDQPDTGTAAIATGSVRIPLHRTGLTASSLLEGVVVLIAPDGTTSGLHVAAAPGSAGPAPVASATTPFWQAILLALLGGLLLNLMPCVFPVLAMKAIAVARLSGQDRGAVRAQALAYTLGVLVAFTGLGFGLLGLRQAGIASGWGFQFQSPIFVAATCWLLFAVGLNLSGVFTIGASLSGTGQRLTERGGLPGSFFTGLLAVLVATPCTAPFMGAALAAAASAEPAIALGIFLALGLGLAAPYTLLAVVPSLARILPRPGRWMDILKGAMAFPMYAAAAWMAWVLSLQAGTDGVQVAASGLVLLGLAAWTLGLAQSAGRRSALLIPALATAAAIALLPGLRTDTPPETRLAEGVERFTPARLDALRAEGRPVFVNMTAAWCVSCLVNERIALAPAPVRQAFAAHHVAYLKGDWTRPDPTITAFLREHASDGVPLYVLYPPHGAPTVLPQILTQADMLARLDALGG